MLIAVVIHHKCQVFRDECLCVVSVYLQTVKAPYVFIQLKNNFSRSNGVVATHLYEKFVWWLLWPVLRFNRILSISKITYALMWWLVPSRQPSQMFSLHTQQCVLTKVKLKLFFRIDFVICKRRLRVFLVFAQTTICAHVEW